MIRLKYLFTLLALCFGLAACDAPAPNPAAEEPTAPAGVSTIVVSIDHEGKLASGPVLDASSSGQVLVQVRSTHAVSDVSGCGIPAQVAIVPQNAPGQVNAPSIDLTEGVGGCHDMRGAKLMNLPIGTYDVVYYGIKIGQLVIKTPAPQTPAAPPSS